MYIFNQRCCNLGRECPSQANFPVPFLYPPTTGLLFMIPRNPGNCGRISERKQVNLSHHARINLSHNLVSPSGSSCCLFEGTARGSFRFFYWNFIRSELVNEAIHWNPRSNEPMGSPERSPCSYLFYWSTSHRLTARIICPTVLPTPTNCSLLLI